MPAAGGNFLEAFLYKKYYHCGGNSPPQAGNFLRIRYQDFFYNVPTHVKLTCENNINFKNTELNDKWNHPNDKT